MSTPVLSMPRCATCRYWDPARWSTAMTSRSGLCGPPTR